MNNASRIFRSPVAGILSDIFGESDLFEEPSSDAADFPQSLALEHLSTMKKARNELVHDATIAVEDLKSYVATIRSFIAALFVYCG